VNLAGQVAENGGSPVTRGRRGFRTERRSACHAFAKRTDCCVLDRNEADNCQRRSNVATKITKAQYLCRRTEAEASDVADQNEHICPDQCQIGTDDGQALEHAVDTDGVEDAVQNCHNTLKNDRHDDQGEDG